jgi:restriction endonuclease Mrr
MAKLAVLKLPLTSTELLYSDRDNGGAAQKCLGSKGITERKIASAILEILSITPRGEASLANLKTRIPHFIALTENDRQKSKSRPTEERWEQRLRNIISHYQTKGNIIYEGLIVQTNRGKLKLTRKGRDFIEKKLDPDNGKLN